MMDWVWGGRRKCLISGEKKKHAPLLDSCSLPIHLWFYFARGEHICHKRGLIRDAQLEKFGGVAYTGCWTEEAVDCMLDWMLDTLALCTQFGGEKRSVVDNCLSCGRVYLLLPPTVSNAR